LIFQLLRERTATLFFKPVKAVCEWRELDFHLRTVGCFLSIIKVGMNIAQFLISFIFAG
jgi:hypothetical protein